MLIKTKNRGFTLVELMIVVAIIAVLSAVAVPRFLAYRQKTRVAQGVATSGSLRNAFGNYAADSHGNTYPTSLELNNWLNFSSLCMACGIRLNVDMKEQGFDYFLYHAIGPPPESEQDTCDNTVGNECVDYQIILRLRGVPKSELGAQISVSPSGIQRQTW